MTVGATRPSRHGGPLTTAAGVLSALYVGWYAVDLTVLGLDPDLFNRVHRLDGGVGPRLVLAVVGLGVLHHALDGAGRAVIDLWPALGRHRVVAAAAGRFVTLAVGLPVAAIVVRPALDAGWFR